MKFTLVRKVYSGTLVQALKAVENFQRRNRIYKEEQRKLRAAARKGQDDGKVAEHH
ncbi:NADH-ubiquinone oxidoreductase-like protein, putative [Medicago truncatula]|uniref:NADH-ubiquinone oxidoreductase-like protein, putative n=1 Tax=Medicago truncatula TaxID=3880 RepID=A0A072TPU4_MEDTR|nr:NADH-ubiquinone oxidoreductase-like protein, putative [Medicago truncatula]